MQMPESNDPFRLDGRVAVITGASGGIGSATAELFLRLGARVMLTDLDPAKLAAVQSRLGDMENCAITAGNCSDEAAMSTLVEATVERFGGLDIMVANAGIEGALKPIDQLSYEEFERVLRTNVLGVWLAIKHAVPAMKSAGKGAIVALSSVAGAIGFPGMAPYTASKHAVYGIVKVAALELGALKIRVNAVAPGPIDNRMMQSLEDQLGAGDPKGFRSFLESRVPMGRYGTNEEIAKLVAFLSSDSASYCTGALYLADGGYVAG
jgi:NAD(P)-dependent dehydrogenase (short-subunit alcohol dehydrogenase family)